MISVSNVRVMLGIANTGAEAQISQYMSAALLDMRNVGIASTVDNALTDMLIVNYCKWQMNYDNQSEKYQKDYIALRNQLSMSESYNKASESSTSDPTEEGDVVEE